MTRLGEIGRRLRVLWQRSRMASDLDDEMQLHMALRQERLQQASLPVETAAVAARQRFGDPLRLREDAMDAWGWRWLEQLGQDIRFALRSLARNPGFAVTAICTLALGIGANTAVFSVVSGVVLRPLPFAEPERLMQISGTSPLSPAGATLGAEAVQNLDEYRRQARSFEAMAGSEVTARYVRRAEGPERVMTVRAEPDFFSILGVSSLRGRTFGPGDPPNVAVIGETFWTARLGGDPAVIGSSLTLDDQPFTIVGVMPASFQFPYRAGSLLTGVAVEGRTDLWIPLNLPLRPRSRMGGVIGRLRPGVGLAAAQAELSAIARQLEAQYPDTNKDRGVRITPLSTAVVSPVVRRPLLVLLGAVGLLLSLACANVANLLLVRLTLRSREIAVRRALGAGRLRLLRQFLTESLLLSLAGGVAGLGLAWWGTRYVMRIAGSQLPRAHEVGLDWRVFLFLLAVCALIGLCLSIAPTLMVGRRDPRAILQESGGHSTMGTRSRRLRDGLVIVEVALALVLAVGAAVLIRELVRLRNTDPGLVTKNVVTFHVGHRMSPATDVRQFYDIAERVERLPAVRAAGFTQLLPLQNWGWASNSIDFQERGRPPERREFPIELRFVTPGYFRALGIPVRGRAFTDRDDGHAPFVILINETLARKSFPGEDPIGKTTTRGRIVGVVGDVRQATLDRPSVPELYTPIAQNWSQVSELGLTLVVNTTDRSERVIDPVRGIVRDTNPNLAVFRIKTMEAVVADSLADFTIYLTLIAAAAGLALVLATTGTYAVISHIAAARTREFAIRVALGADRTRVMRLVLAQGARLAIVGASLGAFGAFTAGRVLQSLPVSVRPPDLTTVGPMAALIALVAIVACLVPARRAAGTDPIEALRSE
jgi:putative ABC transport system permease protein